MIYLFSFLGSFLAYFSLKSLTGGVDYLKFFRRELAREPDPNGPMATIIAPCRGLDDDLKENLSALFRQNYLRWEVVFVVDSPKDAAVPVIQELMAENSGIATRLVFAGAADAEGQKVHNLRAAVKHADDVSEIFVFVDSDARPGPDWLASLVAPLNHSMIGASTGYRWFAAERSALAPALRSAWNASIASALGQDDSSNFCWGGSMAIRRRIFEHVGMGERWRGTLSDDFAVTRAMRGTPLGIAFVPRAISVSTEGCGLRELFEFTNRQMKITRVYAPHLWKLSLFGSGLFCLFWLWALSYLATSKPWSDQWFMSVLFLSVNVLMSIGKSILRLRAIELARPDFGARIRGQYFSQATLWILTPPIFLINGLSALFSREIVWRGIRYRLDSPEKTTIVSGR